jgi:hypothetical protein
LPSINQVYREWEPQGVSVVLVNLHEDRAKVARAVADRGYVAPVALDADGSVSGAYGIRATPTTFLITRDGAIVGRAIGPRAWTGADASALFRALLTPAR